MLSFNRVFFLSLGSVCFLIIPFFWLALLFDYKALENVMITLSNSYLVGYPIPELLGASKVDSIVSQVFRTKIFFSLALLAYSIFFLSLCSVEVNSKRVKFLFRGISVPLFILLVLFWLKFLGEDHIIIKSEKEELFLVTTLTLVTSIFLFSYSLRSKKKNNLKVKKTVPIDELIIPVVSEATPPGNVNGEKNQNADDVSSGKEGEQPPVNKNGNDSLDTNTESEENADSTSIIGSQPDEQEPNAAEDQVTATVEEVSTSENEIEDQSENLTSTPSTEEAITDLGSTEHELTEKILDENT